MRKRLTWSIVLVFLKVLLVDCDTLNCDQFLDYGCHQTLPGRVIQSCFTCAAVQNVHVNNSSSFVIISNENTKTDADVQQVLIQNAGPLNYIPQEVFQKFPGLVAISVYSSSIGTMKMNFLRNSPTLKYFYCNQNVLTKLEENIFILSKNLEQVQLGHNQISEIHRDSFRGLTKLKFLDLRQNKLMVVHPLLFQDLTHLVYLFLVDNLIEGLSENTFVNLKKLVVLQLNQNKIESLTEGIFIGLDELGELGLSGNSISKLKGRTFNQMKKLWKLELANNLIESIEHSTFEGATSLRSIYLINNKISTIKAQSFVILPSLDQILLTNNTCMDKDFLSIRNKVVLEAELALTCDPEKAPILPKSNSFCHGSEVIGHTIESQCEINNREVTCEGNIKAGTEANTRCKFGFSSSQKLTKLRSNCQTNGRWDRGAIRCLPSCGLVKSSISTPLIVGGKETNITQVPWHVGIYLRTVYICGGSIINNRLVVSAAHCFHRSLPNFKVVLEDETAFQIIAGKYYRKIDAVEPLTTQTFGVQEVRVTHSYSGEEGFFVADIAILVLDKEIKFTDYITPICLDFDFKLTQNLPIGKIGKVAGWGWTEHSGNSSDVLKTIEMPVISHTDCKETADEFATFITSDKFCAGEAFGENICRGDSGGGFVLPKTIGGVTAYYLRGVVSNTKKLGFGGCDTYFYTLFTNVHAYIGLIQDAMNAFNPQME